MGRRPPTSKVTSISDHASGETDPHAHEDQPRQAALPAEGMRDKLHTKAEKLLELREDVRSVQGNYIVARDELKLLMQSGQRTRLVVGDSIIEVDDEPRIKIKKRKGAEAGADEDDGQEDLAL